MLLFRIWLNATSSNYVDDEWLIRLTRTPLCREAKKKKQDIIFMQCPITERQRQKSWTKVLPLWLDLTSAVFSAPVRSVNVKLS